MSGTFHGDFNLALNCQTKVTANTILEGTVGVSSGLSIKLNVGHSLFVAKSPDSMSTECTIPIVYCDNKI